MRPFALLFLLLCQMSLFAQWSPETADYIQAYKQLAIEEMMRSGVPAAITLAQGIHESGSGKSDLSRRSNNHFGIKCKSNWEGEKVYHDDDARGECFRSYPTPELSFRDHSDFLRANSRYAPLFQLDPEDYEGWANGLKKAGYATNPRYAQIIVKLIEDYRLQQYTLIALGKIAPGEEILAGINSNPVTVPAGGPSLTAESMEENIHDEELPFVDYPEGVFKINETRVVFARKGTSLLALAENYELPLARLLDFNDLEQVDLVPRDQLIYVQRKRKKGIAAYHIVQRGETPYSISQSEGIRLESLLEYNDITFDTALKAGQKVLLQPSARSVSGGSITSK
jgi:hypothetical protein